MLFGSRRSPQGSALPDIAVERVVHLPIAVSEPGRPPLVLVRKAEPPGDVLPEIQNRLGVLFVRRVQLGRLVRGRGRRSMMWKTEIASL